MQLVAGAAPTRSQKSCITACKSAKCMAAPDRPIASESIKAMSLPVLNDGSEIEQGAPKMVAEGDENRRPIQNEAAADLKLKRRTSESGAPVPRRLSGSL